MEVEHHIHPGEDRAACGGSTVFPSHTALVGTPDEVIEQIEFNRDLIGEHEPSMQINFGGIKGREAFRTLELFAKHVMPRFQTSVGT
jgi:hypothetical protein